MIKKQIIVLFILLANMMNAQDQNEYSKIKFVYSKKSNYHIDENGVFADTVLLKLDFPEIKYTLRRSPKEAKNIVGFIRLKDFDKESKRRLIGNIYHTVEKIEGTYDKKNNKTTFKVSRNDDDTKKLFKNLFKERYYRFDYTVSIDYGEKTIRYILPSTKYNYNFNEVVRNITYFDENKTEGTFQVLKRTSLYDNLIYLNSKLNSKISPYEVFSNNNFGVEMIITVNETISLESVVYE